MTRNLKETFTWYPTGSLTQPPNKNLKKKGRPNHITTRKKKKKISPPNTHRIKEKYNIHRAREKVAARGVRI